MELQDPSYPVYVDSSVIMGMTDGYDESSKGFGRLEYMVCRPENDFFPDLSQVTGRSHPCGLYQWLSVTSKALPDLTACPIRHPSSL